MKHEKQYAYHGPVAAVAFPAAIPGLYDYRIPDALAGKAVVGTPVLVDVKKNKIWGVILKVKDGSEYPELKDIIEIKEGRWADSNKSLLKLYEWIAAYYHCQMGRVFRPIVSKSVINKKAKTVTVYKCVWDGGLRVDGDEETGVEGGGNSGRGAAGPAPRGAPSASGGGCGQTEQAGLFDDYGNIAQYNKNKLLDKKKHAGMPVKSKNTALKDNHRLALENIKKCSDPLTAAELEARFGIKASMLASLCKKGYLAKESKVISREADELSMDIVDGGAAALSPEQLACVESVAAYLEKPDKPFLLYGVTGSGKTHVYVELAKKVLAAGRGVIILVPEISLTPQTILRFRAAIGGAITVIHSRMSDGERRDAMQEVVTGRRRAVIGVRSALLAPMDNVGLIIVDEEHDGSYKQSDTDPRYNARDCAVMRGKLQNAVVVLGSATPSMESYYNALTGKYRLLTLTGRYGVAVLPSVKIVDMTLEHSDHNWSIFSRYLEERVEEELAKGRQIILLLNRRGWAVSLLCKSCGYTRECPNCSVNMRYHKADTALKCHQCGREEPAPDSCPKCRGTKIKYKGTAIQKAEETLAERFPEARILRMDQDSTKRKGAHAAILGTFAKGGADILLGTQMVAKGLNFPNVTLVGVLQADTGLYFPDFRASERTFQLLTQVAGRAGRAEHAGEVVIQTYNPKEVSVRFAAEHDYISFYNHEIKNRRELSYPPFGKVARVIAEGAREETVREFLHKAARTVMSAYDRNTIRVLGPAPAVLSRIDNVYRYSMILKSPSPAALNNALTAIRKMSETDLPSSHRCVIDVDPQNML